MSRTNTSQHTNLVIFVGNIPAEIGARLLAGYAWVDRLLSNGAGAHRNQPSNYCLKFSAIEPGSFRPEPKQSNNVK